MVSDRLEQVHEEWAFGVTRLVFTLCVVAGDFRQISGQQQSQIFDCTGLANARRSIDKRPHDAIAQTFRDKIVESLDGRRSDPVIAGRQGMQRRIDGTWNLD